MPKAPCLTVRTAYVLEHMLKHFLLALFALLTAPAFAASVSQQPNTRVELVSEVKAPAPGQRFSIGLVMTPKPGWHTYWKYPGDSGIETRATWANAPGMAVSPFRYPVPETYVISGIMNHVYGHENVLLAEVDVPQNASGALPLQVKLDWLVCDDQICVPESATLLLPLTTGDGRADPAQQARFADARAALPRTLTEPARFASEKGRIRIEIPLAGTEQIRAAHFFAIADDTLLFAAPQTITRTDSALIIEADAVPASSPQAVEGLLRIERADGVMGLEVRATLGAVAAGQPLAASAGAASVTSAFLTAFGLALLGGLVLNLMPCVFPILSLKALSLARSGHSEAAARKEGLAYTAGVVLVTTLLGAAAIMLARAGAGAGWAFQLQDPRVILLLMLLTLAIGLNFAGLFEMQLGGVSAGQALAAKPGAKGAFWTGTLAAFVATPCTGPFMAGALGAALVLPPVAGLAVFAGLGLGLALPFLAIGFVPALRRRLPKPGAWMVTFRRILVVPMLLTALALAWVLGRQAGAEGLTLGLLFALIVGLGLWWLGLRQHGSGRTLLPAAVAIVAALLAPAALARLPQSAAAEPQAGSGLASVAFSPEKLAALNAASTPTFLYFTADWCLTCKVNEKGALASDAVAQAFEKAGVTVMVGDWTRPDPAIARFLEQRGRAGIPLYLFYAADGTVEELPQILTVDQLTKLARPG